MTAADGGWPSRRAGRGRAALASLREVAGLALRPGHVVAYAGPARSTNAGDALLHRAHGHLLPGLALPPVQHLASADMMGVLPARLRPLGVVLGGGTLVGEPRWRRLLETAEARGMRLLPPVGVGVLDPRSEQFSHLRGELRAWRPMLRRFGSVPVRGPLSMEVLHELDVQAHVVGDPVLALPSPVERDCEPGLLGINVGVSRPARTFGRTDDLVAALVLVGRHWQQQGGRVVLFSVWPPDTAACRSVARGLDEPAEVVEWVGDLDGYLARLQACEVVVAQKLHAVVLAVLARRPVVTVEYQAKCRDLAASLGLGDLCIRMDHASGARLLEVLREVLAAPREVDARAQAARRALAVELHASARRFRAAVGAP